MLRAPYANDQEHAATPTVFSQPTPVQVRPFSTFAVPFAWMLRERAERDRRAHRGAAAARRRAAVRHRPWVFGRARQEALLELFFRNLRGDTSLVFFYTKDGNPLGDQINRLVVGVGRITCAVRPHPFDSARATSDRTRCGIGPFSHSIRLRRRTTDSCSRTTITSAARGDPDEDARRHRAAQRDRGRARPTRHRDVLVRLRTRCPRRRALDARQVPRVRHGKSESTASRLGRGDSARTG